MIMGSVTEAQAHAPISFQTGTVSFMGTQTQYKGSSYPFSFFFFIP